MKFKSISSVAILCASATLLAGCGKPDGMSDAEYKTYKELGAPKILYSCSKTVMDNEKVLAKLKCYELTEPGDSISCADKIGGTDKEVVNVGYTAGVGVDATYNRILDDAKTACGEGEFKVIDSKS